MFTWRGMNVQEIWRMTSSMGCHAQGGEYGNLNKILCFNHLKELDEGGENFGKILTKYLIDNMKMNVSFSTVVKF